MEVADRAKKINPSPTLVIGALAKRMKEEGKDVVGFAAGEPDFDTPQNIKDKAISSIHSGFTKYTPAGGTVELKEAICKKLLTDNNLNYTTNEVIISCGAKHSLYNIFQAILNPGDRVIIPAPYWVSYPEMVSLAGGKSILLKTKQKNRFKITPDELLKKINKKVKALIINSPSNPTGMVYDRKELEAIGRIALENNIMLISDEIYEKIVYDGVEYVSIAGLSPELKQTTIVVNGVSKSYSMTGWRVGYAAGPENIIKAIDSIQSHSTSNPTSIAQRAALEAISGPQESVRDMVSAFKERRDYIVKRLNDIKGISCLKPRGAFYAFPNIKKLFGKKFNGKEIRSSLDLTGFLLKENNVAVVPGIAFGDDNYIRLSYATSMENIQKGMDRIEEGINQLS